MIVTGGSCTGGAVACVDVCVSVVALIVFGSFLRWLHGDIEVVVEALTGHLSYPPAVVAHKF